VVDACFEVESTVALRNKAISEVVKLIRKLSPRDVVEQQKKVEHDYCYSVGEIDASTRQNYLQQAYRLGNEFVQQGDNHEQDLRRC
jgi:hypothetical protein